MAEQRLIDVLNECKKRNKQRLSYLENIIDQTDESQNILDLKENNTHKFLVSSERDYLYSKLLYLYADDSEDTSIDDYFGSDKADAYGKFEYFPSSLIYSHGMYVFTLPPMYSAKRKDLIIPSGKYMKFNILYLLKTTDISIKILRDPVILFEHHVGVDVKNVLSHLADADNLDAKSCQDALQGFLYNDDNVLSLCTIHRGVRDKKSYTRIYVMEKEVFLEYSSLLLKN